MQGPSQTAVISAMIRAAHLLTDPNPVLADPYALRLADKTETDVAEFFRLTMPEHIRHVPRLFQCQRSRFVEDEVERATERGVDQFVDLGAGLSSFAWRRPDLMERLDLFEVDHPATQEYKRDRLDKVGLPCPANLHFAAVDFTADTSLGEALSAVGFDPARPSIWSWLGVVVYLPVDAILSTLTAVAGLAAERSTLITSYCVPDELMEPASREFAQLGREFFAQSDEPQITWLPPHQIETIARDAGWRQVHSVDPASFAAWFAGRTDGLQPVGLEWLLVAKN